MNYEQLFEELEAIKDPAKKVRAIKDVMSMRKLEADSDLAELKASRLDGRLVERCEVEVFAADFCAAFRAHLMRFADAHSHALAQISDAAGVHRYLTFESRRFLENIRSQIDVPDWVDDAAESEDVS